MPTDIETDPQAAVIPDADTAAVDGQPAEEGPAPARSRRERAVTADRALVAAVDQAHAAAIEVAEENGVGDHLGVTAEGDRVLTHLFDCTSAGYRGWRWAVTVARAPRSRHVTVSEVHLLPGPESVVAPTWVPWAERIAPGDVAPGTVLPKRVDDPLLEQGFEATGDEDVDQLAIFELGLGRPRVLSRLGREVAAQRWYDGTHGPRDPHAEQAPAPCRTCGYFVPMAGALRQVFGVCANEWSPSDGSVVSLDHGCGAHSEVDVEARPEPLDTMVLDELGYVDVDVRRSARATAEPSADEPSVPRTDEAVEPMSRTVSDEMSQAPQVSAEATLPETEDTVPPSRPGEPTPYPHPDPYPDPPPYPEPSPVPQPEPVPDPMPAPTPQPGPEPRPQPGPEPVPQPGPEPLPQPGPDPVPQPGPEPLPQPGPEPLRQPGPEPLPGVTQPGVADAAGETAVDAPDGPPGAPPAP